MASTLFAQPNSTQPKFDVVSIRQVSPSAPVRIILPGSTPFLPAGHFEDRASLLYLISMAYSIPFPERQLLGLPKWGQSIFYDVEAKAEPDFPDLSPEENTAQIRLMLREMLADRFKLRLHTETREQPHLTMTVEKSGLRIKEVPAPVAPANPGRVDAALGDDGGRIIGKKTTMSRLADVVSLFLKQEVIDETGLTGYYDFDIRWKAPRVEGAPPPPPSLGDDGIALFISTLKDEFGLRFTKGKGPEQFWVIDSVEPPTEN